MIVSHKKRLIVIVFFFLTFWTIYAFFAWYHRNAPRTIENSDYIVYVPSHINNHVQHPLVIALSPSGDARQMIDAWKGIAEKFQWIVLSSKKFRNGVPGEKIWGFFKDIATAIQNETFPVRIDQKKVIATGLSGGGMGSHMFSFWFPDVIDGVIINTGMMDAEFFYPKKENYPRGKLVVFLASPTDFRYKEMKRDRDFLESLGWRTEWIEFQGGHILAPQNVYFQAAQWIAMQWGNK